jgi:hypothetical protein
MAEPPQGIGIDINELVQQAVVEVFLPNPVDWDEIPEDLFQFDNHVFWQDNDEGMIRFPLHSFFCIPRCSFCF